jgi:hypothetical protein
VAVPQPALAPAPDLRTSGAAMASLIFGLVGAVGGCLICGIPPIVAIITGHIGVARTRKGMLKGHGMALAGLILGYLQLLPTLIVVVVVALRPDAAADFAQNVGDWLSSFAE